MDKKLTHITRYAPPHIGGIEAVINQINESVDFKKSVLCCSNTEKSSYSNGVEYIRCKFLFEFMANTIVGTSPNMAPSVVKICLSLQDLMMKKLIYGL